MKRNVIAVLPAYKASESLRQFFKNFPFQFFNEVILVDDVSGDGTYELAIKLKNNNRNYSREIRVFKNKRNLGYGGNLKRCLDLALNAGADIIVEIHPDGEYGFDGIKQAINLLSNKQSLPAKAGEARKQFRSRVGQGSYKDRELGLVLGNRFAHPVLKSGMRVFKYPFVKFLNFICNFLMGTRIPDLHQGFRVYGREFLKRVNYKDLADDYSFSFEIIRLAVKNDFSISSVPVKTNYSGKKRGASLKASIIYFLKVLMILMKTDNNLLLLSGIKQVCPFCRDKEKLGLKVNKGDFKLFFCRKCKIGFTKPVPRRMSKFYPQNYWINNSRIGNLKAIIFKFFQKRRVKWINKYLDEGRILDVGSGEGRFGDMLQKGFEVISLEPDMSKIKNSKVIKKDFLKFFPKQNFDAIVFWESLEHVDKPQEYLKHAEKNLKEDGLIFIEYPRFNSFEANLFRRNWFHLDMPRHLFHFSDDGLKKLANGFQVVEQKQAAGFEYSIWGFFSSIIKVFGFNIEAHILKPGGYLKLFLLSPFMLIAIGAEIILYVVNQSPIGLIVLRKNDPSKQVQDLRG